MRRGEVLGGGGLGRCAGGGRRRVVRGRMLPGKRAGSGMPPFGSCGGAIAARRRRLARLARLARGLAGAGGAAQLGELLLQPRQLGTPRLLAVGGRRRRLVLPRLHLPQLLL